MGEGTPSERKTVLGWLICTRALRIFLPEEKARFWTHEIKTIIKSSSCIKAKELEKLIGKLNHLGFVIPQARYFLNRIRTLFYNCQKYGA